MTDQPIDPDSAALLDLLVSNHRRFLDFLERRTGSRADAEDVLQGAFLRVLERGGGLRRGESSLAWFYRLLRNALTDRFRHDASRIRAVRDAAEEDVAVPEDELRGEVCRCIETLLPALEPGYADLLRRVDLGGERVRDAAAALDITPNLAGVRLHRARRALFREVQRSCRTCATHGCLDCTCDSAAPGGCGG